MAVIARSSQRRTAPTGLGGVDRGVDLACGEKTKPRICARISTQLEHMVFFIRTESHHASLKQVIPQTSRPLSLSLSLSLWPIATSRSGMPGSGEARTAAAHFRRYFCCTNSAPCFDWATLNVTPSLTRPGTWRQKEMWGTVSIPSRPNLYLLMPMPTAR